MYCVLVHLNSWVFLLLVRSMCIRAFTYWSSFLFFDFVVRLALASWYSFYFFRILSRLPTPFYVSVFPFSVVALSVCSFLYLSLCICMYVSVCFVMFAVLPISSMSAHSC